MLIGNLTRDPELRYTPQGTAVCTFGLATNRSWTPSDGGEKQEETEFHRIVSWSKLAEICSQILYKGRKAYVEGRLQTRKWQTQEGVDRETTEVVIDQMIALGAPKQGFGGGGVQYEEVEVPVGETMASDVPVDEKPKKKPAGKKPESKPKATKTASKKEEVDVDDIPF